MASTRDRIIVSTNELFRRNGYNGTSLKQISKASGATIGSIYHFFPGGKESLGVVVVETTGAAYRQLFEAIVAASTDHASAFMDFFAGAGEVLEESGFIDPCPIGGIAREVANTSEPVRVAAEATFDSWLSSAQTHFRSAGIDSHLAEELAYVFVAMVEGTFVLSRTQRSTKALAAAGEHMAALVEHAIDGSRQVST